jgi:hypothetical protein
MAQEQYRLPQYQDLNCILENLCQHQDLFQKENQNGELDTRRRKLDSKNKALTRHGRNTGDYSPRGEGDDGRSECRAL